MNNHLREHLESVLGSKITSFDQVGGGSVNETGILATESDKIFVKVNDATKFPDMFAKEALGLKILENTGAIKVPEVLQEGSFDGTAYLLLEFIEKGINYGYFWESFGQALAELHKKSSNYFGLDHDNYIGALHQSNNKHDSFLTFFIEERIQPQYEKARKKKHFNKETDKAVQKLFKSLPEIIPEEPSSLIHGDLWSGNYLAGREEVPVLIDPAVCYAHREMDLAMTTLFGGFEELFYDSYDEVFPPAPGLENRIGIYNLYYLLVHVNLFGRAYVSSVERILKEYK